MNYIISYDLGTGGTKASLYDENGNNCAYTFVPCKTYFNQETFHEQRPDDWWQMVVTSTKTLLAKVDIKPSQIVSVAVSGHSLGVVPISRDGELLLEYTPIWSDYRAGKQANRFFNLIDQEKWYMTTGNGFPPAHYSIFKIMWYMDNAKSVFDNTYKFIGTKDYINFKMTGKLCTDHSYASGTGVYDLINRCYKDEFIEASGIESEKLPDIYESTFKVGNITEQASLELGLVQSTQVMCGGVDNACMALGAGCIKQGMSYVSLGSSAWVATTSSIPVLDIKKKPYVFAHCIPGMFASATAIFSAGTSLRWVRDTICADIVTEAEKEGKDPFILMDNMAATSPVGSNRLLFNPTLGGASSLDKSTNAKGGFIGLSLQHTKSDLIRATLEGITLNLRIALEVLQSCTEIDNKVLIVGGGGKSKLWRQIFADVYNLDIIQTNVEQDAGSLGAAAVAAVGSGMWESFDKISNIHKQINVTKPNKENAEKYNKLIKVFKQVADIQSDIGDMLIEL